MAGKELRWNSKRLIHRQLLRKAVIKSFSGLTRESSVFSPYALLPTLYAFVVTILFIPFLLFERVARVEKLLVLGSWSLEFGS